MFTGTKKVGHASNYVPELSKSNISCPDTMGLQTKIYRVARVVVDYLLLAINWEILVSPLGSRTTNSISPPAGGINHECFNKG